MRKDCVEIDIGRRRGWRGDLGGVTAEGGGCLDLHPQRTEKSARGRSREVRGAPRGTGGREASRKVDVIESRLGFGVSGGLLLVL
eukprot:scaffold418022_cov39-Prasinocladus_malaysianus.AAC.1